MWGESLLDYPGRPSVSTRYSKVDKGDREKGQRKTMGKLTPFSSTGFGDGAKEPRDKEFGRRDENTKLP